METVIQIKAVIVFIVLTTVFFSFEFIEAQSISGNVKDELTNVNISNSKVQITNLDNGVTDSVFTNSTGNWYYTLITSVDEKNITIPNSLILEQNYPNPFNPSTRIQFSIPSDENVEISVHNILGELIDFRNQFLQAGNYSIDWSSRGSAGVYFYTIKAGNQSVTKKMVQLDGGNGSGLSEIYSGIINSTYRSGKVQSIPLEIVSSKLGYQPDTIFIEINGNEFIQFYLQSVHSNALMIDLHNDVIDVMIRDPLYDFSIWNNYNHTDIPRLKAGGVDIQFFALWVNPNTYPNYYDQTLTMLNEYYGIMTENPDDIQHASSISEAMNINQQSKIAAMIGVEGGHSIENSLEKLENLYLNGMRYMTITWNNSLDWAISHSDPNSLTQGLSEFGRSVIRKMDSLGIVIDVSHVGIKTVQDILEITENPIIATHSGARAITNNSRNLYDWQIQDIANSGGVIGIVFYPNFLTGTNSATINNVIQHIDHIVNLVGIDYVAIGSDFDGIGRTPVGLENVSKFPNLTLALLEHGYSINDVKKILGENAKRVFEQVNNNAKLMKDKKVITNN